mgnify:CR=1 FL=1
MAEKKSKKEYAESSEANDLKLRDQIRTRFKVRELKSEVKPPHNIRYNDHINYSDHIND